MCQAGEGMDKQVAKDIVLKALYEVAPDLEGVEVKYDADLRRFYDIDSVDYLSFIIKLHKQTGRDIPEADYPKLTAIDRAVAYLAEN
jgi:acyl carrier protein